ncbi:MAG: hypothetical protein QMC14_06030 [Paracoccaceae bacterium]
MAESHGDGDGVGVPMVSRRHGVPTNRIYAWRGDARFQPAASDDPGSYQSRFLAAIIMRRLCSPQRSQRAFQHPQFGLRSRWRTGAS